MQWQVHDILKLLLAIKEEEEEGEEDGKKDRSWKESNETSVPESSIFAVDDGYQDSNYNSSDLVLGQ